MNPDENLISYEEALEKVRKDQAKELLERIEPALDLFLKKRKDQE